MPLSQSIWALPVNIVSQMTPRLFLVLITFVTTFPCTDFRSTLFSQHTVLVATTSYGQHTINNGLMTWRRGVVVITSAQLHSTKPELRFHAGSRPAAGWRFGEDLWQWFRLEIRPSVFHQSTIPQKQFIIITTHSLTPIWLRGLTTNPGSCASQLSGKILHLCSRVLPKQLNISQDSLIDLLN